MEINVSGKIEDMFDWSFDVRCEMDSGHVLMWEGSGQ